MVVLLLHSPLGLGAEKSSSDPRSNVKDDQITKRIDRLIQQLGSEHYATRQQAQEELRRIGVVALDQLHAAILHSDPQIATLARYMIRSSFINWTNENDPMDVRKLLEHYGTGDSALRAERIERLAAMEDGRGLSALLRIARYEVEGRLNRLAALLVLDPSIKSGRKRSQGQTSRDWDSVLAVASQGGNEACRWLNQYAADKVGQQPIQPDFWIQAVHREWELLKDGSGETTREFVEDFTKFVSELLLTNQRRDDALQVARKLLELEFHDRDRVFKAFDWSLWGLDRDFPELLLELSEQPWMQRFRYARIDYLRAEALAKLGREKEAEELAEQVFRRHGAASVQQPIGHSMASSSSSVGVMLGPNANFAKRSTVAICMTK